MPVLVPMSDLIGLSRQVTVLAYQYGAGLTEMVTPTNGALMAVTAAMSVRYDDWLEFAAATLRGAAAPRRAGAGDRHRGGAALELPAPSCRLPAGSRHRPILASFER